ncbi:CAF17-like 4Fe-4S cluster assembly/insertion protein YgfZ [Noviherbaspirillum pedocola]|uniref:Folate-binding protein YgfZ n=1 Tax=Noviherbaspirillum pedocola TaxID=2801341 RepID=A0A934W6Y6_9BURK|nr:folate-binding protein YgfZ [Noviherbaspirillum pedocola]MBK4735715.1 folate-binding protein YgfZ [Noviherbaspirillum pedocola]
MNENQATWLSFLAEQGARLSESTTPEPIGFTDAAPINAGFIAPLTHLGLIAATGEDAASFLHNQLTNDIEHLGPGEARLAGYCTAKGRLLATMLTWKSGDTIYLQLPRELQPVVQTRLQMFILRAKAKLADLSDDFVALGLVGADAELLAPWFPVLPNAPYAKVDTDAGSLIRVADADGRPRFQWIAPLAVAKDAWPTLARRLPPAPPSAWRLTDIAAGMPTVVKATQEQFVPQMVNFEVVGGVNFRKGCYPGQEIVARSQYLGKLKRRMLPATIATVGVAPGMEVFAANEPDQPCGQIVNAETIDGATRCLVELKTAALESGGGLHLGAANGPLLDIGSLPYALIDPT